MCSSGHCHRILVSLAIRRTEWYRPTHGSLVCLSSIKQSGESTRLLLTVTSKTYVTFAEIWPTAQFPVPPHVTKVLSPRLALSFGRLTLDLQSCSCFCRRPFVYQADRARKGVCSWDDQLSAMTYNRFQYYSKLRTYAMDDSALVSSVLLYNIRNCGTDKHFTAQWLLYVPPSLTFRNAKFYPRSVLMFCIQRLFHYTNLTNWLL